MEIYHTYFEFISITKPKEFDFLSPDLYLPKKIFMSYKTALHQTTFLDIYQRGVNKRSLSHLWEEEMGNCLNVFQSTVQVLCSLPPLLSFEGL